MSPIHPYCNLRDTAFIWKFALLYHEFRSRFSVLDGAACACATAEFCRTRFFVGTSTICGKAAVYERGELAHPSADTSETEACFYCCVRVCMHIVDRLVNAPLRSRVSTGDRQLGSENNFRCASIWAFVVCNMPRVIAALLLRYRFALAGPSTSPWR